MGSVEQHLGVGVADVDALAGEATAGGAREEIEDALGCTVAVAAATAGALLGRPHPLVAAAAAVWRRPDAVTAALARWLGALPDPVAAGDIPAQSVADAWARERSRGLIDRFPLGLTPAVVLVLASALATKVSWHTPYTLAPAADLGARSPWAGRLTHVLRPAEPGHGRQYIAVTDRAGDVAVHTAWARGGLSVTSVAAAPDVPAADVLAAAHRLAVAEATGVSSARRSLFDLPLGRGPAWTLTQGEPRAGGRGERCTAALPAWSARTDHDLLADPRLGFAAATAGLVALLPPADYGGARALQAAVARYSRVGFEAAAISGIAVPSSAVVWPDGPPRTADLRFAHPYAVVAVTVDEPDWAAGTLVRRPWHGLPVFSAWVTEPDDAS